MVMPPRWRVELRETVARMFAAQTNTWRFSVTTRSGIDRLLGLERDLLRGKRFGLVAHPASVDATGCPSAVRLREKFGDGLAALFSPEHGFFGIAGAGDHVASIRHPAWDISIHSLYGKTRRPTPAMLRGLDAIVFDLQALSIRCYTYISTLRYLLEAAHGKNIRIIVTDRWNPLAGIVDGPVLDPKFASFVGCVPGPFVYGLTPGAAARHMARSLKLKIKLDVCEADGRALAPHQWISPSPAIRTPHSALCYPVTVGFEALPAIDYGRKTLMPFELIGAPGLNEQEFCDRLHAHKLPGILFHPVAYERDGTIFRGARIAVTHPDKYRPAASAVAVLETLQAMLGAKVLWRTAGSRPKFFDQLWGTDSVRRAIQSGTPWQKIVASWPLERWTLKVER